MDHAWLRLREYVEQYPNSSLLKAWQQVDGEIGCSMSHHQESWWHSCGRALAALLCNAQYTESDQLASLRYFATAITPYLGVSQAGSPHPPKWSSFITDDGTPIQFSWAWRTVTDSPTVQYMVEPVGPTAGTVQDPHNRQVTASFHKQMIASLPGTSWDWYNHFARCFIGPSSGSNAYSHDHNSTVFYGFDLKGSNVYSKAYFFPTHKANATNRDPLDIVQDAILSAPHCTPARLPALQLFNDWRSRLHSDPQLEKLGIDLSDPTKSRLKIYFRHHETNFDSVIAAMTLGGRLNSPALERGLQQLQDLWIMLFGHLDELEHVDHPTAGILYSIEFRLNSKVPMTKVYIPVRHYCDSDADIVKALARFMTKYNRDEHLGDYVRSLRAIFSEQALRDGTGVQTYIGCSICDDGSLSLVSYINPQAAKLRDMTTSPERGVKVTGFVDQDAGSCAMC